jgi:hypothetical protein
LLYASHLDIWREFPELLVRHLPELQGPDAEAQWPVYTLLNQTNSESKKRDNC